MSRTDKDRPHWVRSLDPLDRQSGKDEHYDLLHARGECDFTETHDRASHRDTYCTAHIDYRIYTSARQSAEGRIWHRQDRAAQRRIAVELRRAANSGCLDEAEDMIDHRQTHRGAAYHGGWWS